MSDSLSRSRTVAWYLGTAQLVDTYGATNARRVAAPDKESRDNAFALLEAGVTNGVAGFDTARKYGGAEAVLGEFARAHGVTLPVVTKILDTATDTLSDNTFVDTALTAIETAQARLRPLHLQAVLFHDPETAVQRRVAVRALTQRAAESFPTVAIGASVYEERQVHEDAWRGAAPVYQIPGNALDRRLLGLSWSDDQRIMVRSVFLQGLLVNRGFEYPPGVPAGASVLARYREIVAQYALDPIATAIAAVHRHRPTATLVLGAEVPDQIAEVASSLTAAEDVPPDAIRRIDALAGEVPVAVIDPRKWTR